MQVILMEKIKNVGDLGETVKVKPGYGRNFLIPQNKAVSATKKNIALFEERRAGLEKKAHEALLLAQKRAELLNSMVVKISAQASDEGKLYGSIGPVEIKQALESQSCEVHKQEIVMPEGPLHSIGEYVIEIHVHSDVIARLQVEVVSVK